MSDLTVVTGVWDLGREQAGEGFSRSFGEYRERFGELLQADVPMLVFGDEGLRSFVLERRGARPTDFRVRPAASFRDDFPFYDRVQTIRTDPRWRSQAPWLGDSPQATLELYNPMVMSKMFMLHDAALWNPFRTSHVAWIDGGITRTVHPGYFTHDRVLSKVEQLLGSFFFVTFPYTGGGEVHGFSRAGMREFCGTDSTYVCRGGFFGGHVDCLSEVNTHYYELLSGSLHEGYMGTEESVFTIMAYEEPSLYKRYELREDDGGLLAPFFEHVKDLPELTPATPQRPRRPAVQRRLRGRPDVSGKTVGAYVVTFNAPDQLEAVLESWAPEFHFDALYVLDNSTDEAARARNREITAQHDGVVLSHPNGNGGVCGARQLLAETFGRSSEDYCLFLEDDMFLNPPSEPGVCPNGFRRSVANLRDTALRIMEREEYDFLKFSFTEFYGDNKTQFAWYNVPQSFRAKHWPEKPHLPPHGLDPNSPATVFQNIGTMDGLSYIDGEVYYCNWPHLVSKAGNRRMFLDTVFDNPFEQTWMSHMYQLTLKGDLRPAVLLASLVTHNRFHHYPPEDRREN